MFQKTLTYAALIVGMPLFAMAAPPKTFGQLVDFLVSYINFIIPIVISAAVLFYVYNTGAGIWKMKGGDPGPDWKQGVLWGVIAITLMVSIWGILSILAATFHIPVR